MRYIATFSFFLFAIFSSNALAGIDDSLPHPTIRSEIERGGRMASSCQYKYKYYEMREFMKCIKNGISLQQRINGDNDAYLLGVDYVSAVNVCGVAKVIDTNKTNVLICKYFVAGVNEGEHKLHLNDSEIGNALSYNSLGIYTITQGREMK